MSYRKRKLCFRSCIPLLILLFFSQIKRPEVDGYSALQIGAFDCPPKNVTKPLLFHFQAAGVAPKRVLKEFPVTHDAVVPVGRCYSQVFTAGPSC